MELIGVTNTLIGIIGVEGHLSPWGKRITDNILDFVLVIELGLLHIVVWVWGTGPVITSPPFFPLVVAWQNVLGGSSCFSLSSSPGGNGSL